jgi:hypothetical protein
MNTSHREIVEKLYHVFMTCPDPNKKEHAQGWAIQEILGHLVDSVSNNHQRLLRYTPHENFHFPGYAQNDFVARAQYCSFDFQRLLSLWYHYNHLLLHIIDHIPQDHWTSPITIGAGPTITLEQLINDYFAHIEKHERQIQRILAA